LSGSTPVSVLLYGTMAGEASDEQLDVREPAQGSAKGPASVILRPIPLLRLAELLDPNRRYSHAAERRQWAEDLVSLPLRKPMQARQGHGVQAA
jgi:hypothetical protein